MRFHYKVREGEESEQHVDVTSLYPFVRKYFKFRVGHPTIRVDDARQDREAMLQNVGLIKCYVTTPETLPCSVALSLQGQAVLLVKVVRQREESGW